MYDCPISILQASQSSLTCMCTAQIVSPCCIWQSTDAVYVTLYIYMYCILATRCELDSRAQEASTMDYQSSWSWWGRASFSWLLAGFRGGWQTHPGDPTESCPSLSWMEVGSERDKNTATVYTCWCSMLLSSYKPVGNSLMWFLWRLRWTRQQSLVNEAGRASK